MTEMSQWIETVCISALFITLIIRLTDGYSAVKLDASNCNSEIIYISHSLTQTIEWLGEDIPNNCRIGFSATDEPHSVCVNIRRFRIDKCSFTLKVYEGSSNYASKTYDCHWADKESERCFSNKQIYLGFTQNNTRTSYNSIVTIEVKNQQAAEDDTVSDSSSVSETVSGVVSFFILCGFLSLSKRSVRDCARYQCRCLLQSLCGCCGDVVEALCKCCQDCDASECGEVLSCCQTRNEEPEVTTANSTVEITITQQPDFDTEVTLDLEDPPASTNDNSMALLPYEGHPLNNTLPDAPPPSYYDVVTDYKNSNV